jgi:hypothetical protein
MIYGNIDSYSRPEYCTYECPQCRERQQSKEKQYCEECEVEKINISVARD